MSDQHKLFPVKVPCRECGGVNRAARRSCKNCRGSGVDTINVAPNELIENGGTYRAVGPASLDA